MASNSGGGGLARLPAALLGSGLSSRTKVIAVCTSVGLGVLLIGWFRYLRRKRQDSSSKSATNGEIKRTSSVRTSGRTRASPSFSAPSTDHGSIGGRSVRRQDSQNPESLLGFALENLLESIRSLERVVKVGDMVRNRSEKDKERVETVEAMLQRVKDVQAELLRMLEGAGDHKDGALSPTLEEVCNMWPSSNRGGTLSVLSDDSFMSALDDMAPQFDDLDVLLRDPLNLDPKMLILYKQGMKEAEKGRVSYRKSRADFCNCDSEDDFAAKLWCLRQAFTIILSDEHNRQWLVQHGRQLIADLMRHARKDPSSFFIVYDKMISFLSNPSALEDIEEELKHRRVVQLGFWDVVLDFILIDAFEDLGRPPSAVLAVAKNRFLSDSFKESTLTTVIWSMLKAKRQRLQVNDGFIAHFYDISEHVSPPITWGFLGTNEQLRELCYYFKDQMCTFVTDVFDVQRVRFTSVQDLADDVWIILRTRLEMVQTRLSTELLPPD